MNTEVKRNSEILQVLFTYRKVDDLEQYLSDHPDLNIIKLVDSQGNNILHQLAYEGHLELIKVLVRKAILRVRKSYGHSASKSIKSQHNKQFKNWIDQRNNEGFTPLLYAAYSGHLDIIKFLVEQHQADIKFKTNTGLNVLHLAAQKNMVMPFIYFRNRISLQDLDDLQSTPLHWAAYTNSQEVAAYILSQTEDISNLNTRDAEGNTPLMLAVIYGNTRIVRRLLIKGVDRYIKNNENLTPLQMAINSEFNTIRKMLDENFSIFDFIKFYCNIKIEYKPKRKRYVVPLLFIVALAINLVIVNFFINFEKLVYLYSEIALMSLLVIFYLNLLCYKPSKNPKNYETFIDEYNQRSIKKVCFICRDRIPRRGYHCDTCGVCIPQYDHHCTWINNCVGKSNLGRFIIFIMLLVLAFAFIGMTSILAFICIISEDQYKFEDHITFRQWFTNDLEKICLLFCFVVNMATTVFIGPVFLLFLVQIRNLLTNKTTFEKMRSPNEDRTKIKSQIHKRSKVSLRNCRVMMCGDNRGSFTTTKSSFSELLTQKYPSQRTDTREQLKQ